MLRWQYVPTAGLLVDLLLCITLSLPGLTYSTFLQCETALQYYVTFARQSNCLISTLLLL